MTSIAGKLKVSIGTLIAWIGADPERSARVKTARTQTAKIWDEMALSGITAAADPFELAKAKEAAHHYRWRAKAIAPKDYGDKTEIEHSGAIDIGLAARIEAARKRTGAL